jgi:hypothetical protein
MIFTIFTEIRKKLVQTVETANFTIPGGQISNNKHIQMRNGFVSSKNGLVFFWAYFIRIARRNNFVEENFSIRALFRRENSI